MYRSGPLKPRSPSLQPKLLSKLQLSGVRHSIQANVGWAFIGKLSVSLSQWALIVALAKLANPEAVGHFALAAAVSASVIAFTNLQLRGVQATDSRGEYEFSTYLSLRIVMSLVSLLLISGIAVAVGFAMEVTFIIIAVGVTKAFESVSDVAYGLFQQHERMDHVAKSQVMRSLLMLPVICVVMYSTRSLLLSTIAIAIVAGIRLIAFDLPVVCRFLDGPLHFDWSTRRILKLAWLALPFGITTALVSLEFNIPRFFIERHLDSHALGVFAALACFIPAGRMVVASTVHASVPRLARHFADGEYGKYLRLTGKVTLTCAVAGLVGVAVVSLCGASVLHLLYGSDYASHSAPFLMIALAATARFVCEALHHSIRATRYFRIQLICQIFFVGIHTGLSWLMILNWGLEGAALGLLIASSIEAIGFACLGIYLIRNRRAVRHP